MHPPSSPRTCLRCASTKVRGPSRLWLAAVGGAWLYGATSFYGGILLGPGIITILPFLVPAAACVIAESHRRAFAPWQCLQCGAIVPAATMARPGGKLESSKAIGPARAA